MRTRVPTYWNSEMSKTLNPTAVIWKARNNEDRPISPSPLPLLRISSVLHCFLHLHRIVSSLCRSLAPWRFRTVRWSIISLFSLSLCAWSSFSLAQLYAYRFGVDQIYGSLCIILMFPEADACCYFVEVNSMTWFQAIFFYLVVLHRLFLVQWVQVWSLGIEWNFRI